MMCQATFGDKSHHKSLLETEFLDDKTSSLIKLDQRHTERNKQANERRSGFLSGWETGVDGQLSPPKVVYTMKPVTKQRDQQPSFANKSGIRSKSFIFVQSLGSEAYLKHYTEEHSYLSNLYATGAQQQHLLLRHSPSPGGFPVRLSSPPPLLPPPPPPPPQPQPQPQFGGGGGGVRAARGQPSAEEVTHIPMGHQVDLLTKKVLPASYFIISGKTRPEPPTEKRLEPLTLLTERTFKFLTDSSEIRQTQKLEAKSGTPRLTHSKPRVPTAERARLRDFSSAHFAPALQQRLRLLTEAQVAAVAAASSASVGSGGEGSDPAGALEVNGISRGNSRLSETAGGGGAELQGLITAAVAGSRWYDAPPRSYVTAARGDGRKK